MNRQKYSGVLNNERGVALVVTLGIVAILMAGALQLGKLTGDSVMGGLKEKELFQAEQFALSGVSLAKLLLIADAEENEIDSIQEVWANPDKLALAAAQITGSQGNLTIKITDELSKIQVNALVREYPGSELNVDLRRILENFFRLRFSSDKTKDERDPVEIINSMKDWLDSNDDDAITGLSGAESEYYQDLDPPYECFNSPFNHVDELFSVKGVTRDILTTTGAGQGMEEEENPDQAQTLDDVFTVYGLDSEKGEQGGYRFSGTVNINTAGRDVLAAILPEGMEDMALDLIDFREERSEQGNVFVNALDTGWYKTVITLSDKEQDRLDSIAVYSSHIFRVECTAREKEAQLTLAAVLKREKIEESGKWTCRTLQMERIQ
ncbi:general secretion pathway protein GspK [Desulfospira joergensenii]|uniref:general secretion pathway protein GspK n=1 Tax=Desulfospira joergensenii TaxID=53329 RepID=UPI000480DD6E|nr:type II secretion system protein GspK [Desulfospira joergensenii]